MPTDPEAQRESMIRNLKQKTGRSLQQWVKLAKDSGLGKHKQIIGFLKAEHGLTYGYANLVALETLSPSTKSPLDGQYAGAKAGLRPIYEALALAIAKFGPDVQLSVKKTYVSLRRDKQFGLIQPSTRTRVDVGINLKGVKPSGRLEASGSFNQMVSHRVRLTTPDDVDQELIGWLRQAYELA